MTKRTISPVLAAACALLQCCLTWAGPAWQVSVNETHVLPQLTVGGARGFETQAVFFGANWAWAHTQFASTLENGTYASVGRNSSLGFELTTTAQQLGHGELRYQFQLNAAAPRQNVVGGGLVFKFDLGSFGGSMGNPLLLPGNSGWQWGRPGGPQVAMRFTPGLPAVFFERGNPAEVRAYFYSGNIPAGVSSYTATLSWNDAVNFAPTMRERLGGKPVDSWPKDALEPNRVPIDLAFMNANDKPAGRHGLLQVNGDALQFADGTPARFWGTNISAYALYQTPREAVQQQAKRLAALGFNLVRLHHHDSPWVSPNVFGNPKTYTNTQNLSADSLDKLDWWVKCLKDEGIYVWLDMHVQRGLKSGDNIYGFDEIRKGKDQANLKGYSHVNLTIQQAMKHFQQAYLDRKNPYTGLAYKDEPAVAALLITNENDITHHFGNALLPDKGVPLHNKLYTAEANAFASAHSLPSSKVWRSWEHGPSKLILNDLEQRFGADMVAHLRQLGMMQPAVTTSSWGGDPISSLPALTAGNMIDVHSYGGAGQLEMNPMVAANAAHWMAAAQVVGMPLTVTEWNAEPFPLPDRHALPLYIAATASHQGWDALMHYAYSQESFQRNSPSNWHAYNDPSLLPMLSAAALLYRERHVHPATSTYVFDPGAEVFYNQAISAGNAPALRTAMEKGKLLIAMPATKELPWLQRKALPAGATMLRDPAKPVIDPNATRATTDTGELTRNWEDGTYTINTPRTRAAMGWIGGKTVHLQDVTLALSTRNASVAVQSLNEQAVGQSNQLLISIGTRSQPQPGKKTPFLVEPLEGSIHVKAPKGLKAYRNGPFNQWLEMPSTYADGRYTMVLDGSRTVQWLMLR